MRQKLERTISLIALVAAALIPWSNARAQDAAPPSLQEQLEAQYKSVKMGSDSNGPTVLEEGTVLAIQKGGILGVPWGSPKGCPSKYENGNLKSPGLLCKEGRAEVGRHAFGAFKNYVPGGSLVPDSNRTNTSDTRLFNKGEKVYPSSIAVDLKNARIAFHVVACDTCNQTNPPTYYKSEVDFQFAKGYLETADVSKVEDTLGEVFAIDNSTSETPQTAPPAVGQAAAPASIQLGQTVDQVVAILGQPERIANLGSKQIYAYKDLKVTFIDGKVSDVQ